jgi:hypothetical protein
LGLDTISIDGGTVQTELIAGFTDAMNQMEVNGRSARQLVTVRRSTGGKITVRVATGALNRLRNADEVAEEIRSALAAALVEYDRQYFALRWQFFGSRLGDERVGQR